MDLSYARQVLEIEAKAIEELGPRLGETFKRSVSLVLDCRGQVVLTGMGKAGIIAQKISATFASTMTPSIYLHPADAYHGDLGRVRSEDLVIALSNSGETEEIVRLIPKLKAMGAKIIAITATKSSTLAGMSDITLEIGPTTEPCPIGLAPSASTACMMALGDALSLTVAKERGLSEEAFAALHPGGDIGKKFKKVSDLMRTNERNPVIDQEAPVKDALFKITECRSGAVSLVDSNGRLVGIFTDGDLRRNITKNPDCVNQKIKSLMTKSPLTISPDKFAWEAAAILTKRQIDEMPVVDSKNKPIGMLDIQDLVTDGLA